MTDLVAAANALIDSGDSPAITAFVEQVTFAPADDIRRMLREVLAADWMGLPPWARNLSYRLACLQQPDDADLLEAAATDLYSFGPDWDDQAERLGTAAERVRAGTGPASAV